MILDPIAVPLAVFLLTIGVISILSFAFLHRSLWKKPERASNEPETEDQLPRYYPSAPQLSFANRPNFVKYDI